MGMNNYDAVLEDILQNAIKYRCSDIHLTLKENRIEVWYRRHKTTVFSEEVIDTSLYEKLKYWANFDMSKADRPQSGGFSYILDRVYYLRFSTIETFEKKQGVLRILNVNYLSTLEVCLQSKSKANKLLKMVNNSYGLILICGITGSGKSTTLFHTLNSFKDKKIFLLENPVEQILDHTIQLKIDSKLSLENAITEILRHDPDIISIGEVRSKEEVGECIRASYSGHCVITTLHCANITQVFNRLLDLGCSYYDILYTLQGVVFQRLFINKKGETKIGVDIYNQEEINRLLTLFKDERTSGIS